MTSSNPITPVTLLTGFLGSGKTTLLNHLLQLPDLAETAVLINEYGATPIDHLLVRAVSGNVAVLANGCLCCSVAGDLVGALRDLWFKRASGEVPPFRRVVIETTGLADPAPILHTLIEMPLVASRYTLGGVVTTVDAEHGAATLDAQFEAVKQVAVADRLVVTKTARLSADQLAALHQRLTTLNPLAPIIDVACEPIRQDINLASLLDSGLYAPGKKTPDVNRWLGLPGGRARRPVNALGKTGPGIHDRRIRSCCLNFEAPVDWDALVAALDTLTAVRGEQLLRVKGIVNVQGEATPRVIHAVQHTLYPVARLAAWPDDNRDTRLVFILRDLDPTLIEKTFAAFLAPYPAAT